jgi:hypothetical protein
MSYSGLTVDFVHRVKGDVIVKGIRDSDDLRNELRQANVNMIAGDVETVFLFTHDQTALISSTLIRQVCELGGLEGGNLQPADPAARDRAGSAARSTWARRRTHRASEGQRFRCAASGGCPARGAGASALPLRRLSGGRQDSAISVR